MAKLRMEDDSQRAWHQFQKNEEYKRLLRELETEEARRVINSHHHRLISEMPEVLADLFARPVSIETLLIAKLACKDFEYSSGMLENLTRELHDTLPDDDKKGDVSKHIQFIEKINRDLVGDLEYALKSTSEYLNGEGLSKEEWLLQRLSEESAERWKAGSFTIGELFLVQPELILIGGV